MSKLTDKQEMFCQEYIKDLNATQAAIRAGYSERTASVIGSENLSKKRLRDRIKFLQPNAQLEKYKEYNRKQKNDIGFIYLLKIKGFHYYKIGKSTDVISRIKQLQTGIPFELDIINTWEFKNVSVVEKHIHIKLSKNRIRGEWFLFSDRELKIITNYIANIKEIPIVNQLKMVI